MLELLTEIVDEQIKLIYMANRLQRITYFNFCIGL